MPEQDVIMWPFEVPKHINIRSKKHQKFLIERYNEGKPMVEQVSNIAELMSALKNEMK